MSPLLLILRWSTVLVLTVALGCLAYAVTSAPSREATRFGLRGLKRQTSIRKSETWAQFEPLVRWLGVRLSRFITDDLRAKLDEQISQAGDYLGLVAEEYVALCLLSGVGGVIVGVIAGFPLELGGGLSVVFGGVLGLVIPYMQIGSQGTERLRAIARGLPYVIDLMSLSMGAGLDFPGAVRQVVEKSSNPEDPIVEEFTLLLQGLNLGRTRRDALLEFGRRAPVDTVREFVNALVQAEDRGNPVAEVLAIQAGVSRQRRSTRAEESAAKAGVQMIMPLALIFFAILGLVLGPAIMNLGRGLT